MVSKADSLVDLYFWLSKRFAGIRHMLWGRITGILASVSLCSPERDPPCKACLAGLSKKEQLHPKSNPESPALRAS